MNDAYFEEVDRFTIYCRHFYDNSWRVSLYFYGAIRLVVKFENKEDALIFFDLKCEELKNLLKDWNASRQETGFFGDDILYTD